MFRESTKYLPISLAIILFVGIFGFTSYVDAKSISEQKADTLLKDANDDIIKTFDLEDVLKDYTVYSEYTDNISFLPSNILGELDELDHSPIGSTYPMYCVKKDSSAVMVLYKEGNGTNVMEYAEKTGDGWKVSVKSTSGKAILDYGSIKVDGSSSENANNEPAVNEKPVITEISQNCGPESGGNTVYITGKNLTGECKVNFGDVSVDGIIDENGHIVVKAPPGKGRVNITVTTQGGTSAVKSATHYTYESGSNSTSGTTLTSPSSQSTSSPGQPNTTGNSQSSFNGTIILQVGNPNMTFRGVSVPIDNDGSKPVIFNSRICLPISGVINAMGGTTSWNANNQQVNITLKGNTIVLTIGSTSAQINGQSLTMDTAPYISETSHTMIPIRFVTNNLGGQITWDGSTQSVTISY